MARRRANSPVRSRRRRHDESSDSDGYFQAPLVVKPLASPLRESAAPYNSPDMKEYKHASKAKSRSRSSSEASSSGSDDESEDDSGSSSSSGSQSESESASDESSSDSSSSKSGSQSSDGDREPERPTNGNLKNSRDSPKGTVKRKSDRQRSESPNTKRPKESSKKNGSPERRRKSSPVQRRSPSPQRRKSPRRDRRKSPSRRDSERRRSVERRRSPRREKSPRRASPRREPQNRRRDSPKNRRTSPRDQRSRNDRRDRRSPRGRENETRRPNDSRRDGDSRRENESRRENDSKRDRVRVKNERISPDAGRDRGNREQRSPELSKWADDQDRRLDNRRPKGPERPKNKQDRLGEMKRRNEEMEAAERKCVWGKQEVKKEEEVKPEDKQKPDLGLSGKLAEDTNVFNGVVVKYNEPPEAKKPKRRWRLYVFKGDDVLPFIPLHRQSAYLLGRDRRVADIPVDHPSCSKQHAVLQYRSVPYQRADGSKGRRVRPYVLDLDSANGTFVNNKRIEGSRYVELFERDVLKFGFSSREYVLIPEDAAEMNEEENTKATAPENGDN